MIDDRITVGELREMFGPTMPMAAAAILMDTGHTPATARAALVQLAEWQKPLVVAREIVSAISDGWGDQEDDRVAHEIAPILARHFGCK